MIVRQLVRHCGEGARKRLATLGFIRAAFTQQGECEMKIEEI